METYKLHVAGLERDLPICPLNDNLSIAGFVMFGDVEFRSSWQGRWVAFGDYYIDIAQCRDNLCTFRIFIFEESKPRFNAKIRLLSYDKAEVINKGCTLQLQVSSQRAPLKEASSSSDSPYLLATKNTCFSPLEVGVSYQQNKVHPAFDCTKARTSNEKTICHSSEILLGYYDILLNDFYAELLKNHDTKKATTLKESQKLWLENVKECDGDVECLLKSYRKRLEELDGQYCVECS